MSNNKYTHGAIAGGISASIFHPLDALRVRIFYKQPISLPTIMDGYSFNVSTTLIKSIISYPLRDTMKDSLSKWTDHNKAELGSAVGSGIVLGLFATPINVIKVSLQAGHHPNFVTTCKNIYTKNGPSGFYNGGVATVLRDSIWNSIYFPVYELILSSGLTKEKPVASIVAAASAVMISYPFDGIRLYRQHGKTNYNFWHGFWVALQWNSANFKSLGLCLIRVPSATALTHMTYLYLNKKM